MQPDPWQLYKLMIQSRLFEEAVAELWEAGHISGEMHLGIGEEAIAAGVISQLEEGDTMALDHRGTPPALMRGVDPVKLLLEFLGHKKGLCKGMGGHMHIFSKSHGIASTGIVGATGPMAAGFALSAQYLRPGKIALTFFGDGAMNQGMLLESFNLAAAWNLPLIFICKDNGWAITTKTAQVTAGDFMERAVSFGLRAREIDGEDIMAIYETAGEFIERARGNRGPGFLHIRCTRPGGHFLGDQVLRLANQPFREFNAVISPLIKSILKIKGASVRQRSRSLGSISSILTQAHKEQKDKTRDPVLLLRQKLISDKDRLRHLEKEMQKKIGNIINTACTKAGLIP